MKTLQEFLTESYIPVQPKIEKYLGTQGLDFMLDVLIVVFREFAGIIAKQGIKPKNNSDIVGIERIIHSAKSLVLADGEKYIQLNPKDKRVNYAPLANHREISTYLVDYLRKDPSKILDIIKVYTDYMKKNNKNKSAIYKLWKAQEDIKYLLNIG